MANKKFFNPAKLAVYYHPGEFLSETISEQGMSVKEFAIRTGKPEKTIHAIISGKSSITDDMALAFEKVTHVPAHFWMNKQHNYDAYRSRKRAEEKERNLIAWVKNFPYKEMVENGWIEPSIDALGKVTNLLRFFRIDSDEAWEDLYYNSKLKVSYRISLKNSKNPYALSAWLRYGEILAEKESVETDYSQVKLMQMLPTLLDIIYSHPKDFAEQVKKLLNHCGIKIVYIKHLPKATVSGCVRWIQDIPCIMLTDRQKRYDIICFSLLHEIAHILKHGKKDVFIESEGLNIPQKEQEAEDFARQMLLPHRAIESIVGDGNFSYSNIYRISIKYHVNPSVLVGALIHDNIISYKTHGKLLKQQTLIS